MKFRSIRTIAPGASCIAACFVAITRISGSILSVSTACLIPIAVCDIEIRIPISACKCRSQRALERKEERADDPFSAVLTRSRWMIMIEYKSQSSRSRLLVWILHCTHQALSAMTASFCPHACEPTLQRKMKRKVKVCWWLDTTRNQTKWYCAELCMKLTKSCFRLRLWQYSYSMHFADYYKKMTRKVKVCK